MLISCDRQLHLQSDNIANYITLSHSRQFCLPPGRPNPSPHWPDIENDVSPPY